MLYRMASMNIRFFGLSCKVLHENVPDLSGGYCGYFFYQLKLALRIWQE